MKAEFARGTIKFLRAARYVTEIMVWSRIFTARRTRTNIRINHHLLAQKNIPHNQPQLGITRCDSLRHFVHGFDIIFDILFANLRKPGSLLPMRHALPGPAFAGIYLWDSAFIALIWRFWDTDVAVDVLHSVLLGRSGERLQHVIADFGQTEFTQPPLIAWALMRGGLDSYVDVPRLRQIYDILKTFNRWLNDHRRLPCGLYFWLHPYESGVENSPRFSSRDEKTFADTRQLAAPDFSTYMVLQCEALAALACRLGDYADEENFLRQAREIRRHMEHWLWHDGDGLYYDWDPQNSRHIRSRTIASLIPLAAGVPSPERAARIRQQILDPASFATQIPLPSVALRDPDFERDMWRGPVWINTAFLVLDGLQRYEFHDDYTELAWRLCEGVFRVLEDEHQVYEFYDPEYLHTRLLQRKKGNWWKALTLGTGPQKDFVGWTGLVNVLVIEALFGVRVRNGAVTIRPAFQKAEEGASFTLALPQLAITLFVDVMQTEPHVYQGKLQYHDKVEIFELSHGDTATFTLTRDVGV